MYVFYKQQLLRIFNERKMVKVDEFNKIIQQLSYSLNVLRFMHDSCCMIPPLDFFFRLFHKIDYFIEELYFKCNPK